MKGSALATGLDQDELAICELKLSKPCNFHGRDMETVGDLVKQLAGIQPTLSAKEYVDEYPVAAGYLSDALSENTTGWVKLFNRLDKRVQHIKAWKEFRDAEEYKQDFGQIQCLRDYRLLNKRSAEKARSQILSLWPTYGLTLLHLHDTVEGRVCKLLTLATKERDERLAMEGLLRAVIKRLERNKTNTSLPRMVR